MPLFLCCVQLFGVFPQLLRLGVITEEKAEKIDTKQRFV